jgi:hypothetical protein
MNMVINLPWNKSVILLTNSRGRVLLEKPRVAQPLKKVITLLEKNNRLTFRDNKIIKTISVCFFYRKISKCGRV